LDVLLPVMLPFSIARTPMCLAKRSQLLRDKPGSSAVSAMSDLMLVCSG